MNEWPIAALKAVVATSLCEVRGLLENTKVAAFPARLAPLPTSHSEVATTAECGFIAPIPLRNSSLTQCHLGMP